MTLANRISRAARAHGGHYDLVFDRAYRAAERYLPRNDRFYNQVMLAAVCLGGWQCARDQDIADIACELGVTESVVRSVLSGGSVD